MTEFEQHGFYKDYYCNGKYIGSMKTEKDREVLGYDGRKTEILGEPIVFSKTKKIRKGAEVITEIYPICGKIIKND